MIITAVVFFVVAALFGAYLLYLIISKKETPKGLAFTHGSIAFIGVLLLLFYVLIYSTRPWPALLLFILAACGGAVLIIRDITGKTIPSWMAIGHGATAVTALIVLVAMTS